MKLTNQTILITGGTSGIGRVLGEKLLGLGNTVILLGRNAEKLEEAKKKGFATIQCDLTNRQEIESAVVYLQNDFPQLTMLFNNAGVQYNYQFTDSLISIDKIENEINANLTGQVVLTYLLLPLLHTAEKACIINTTSGLGAFPKLDGLVYSASKAAMRNFTVGLRYALKKTSICVLEFIPPVTDTGMTKGRSGVKISAEDLISQVLPQLKKERKIITVPKMRLFLWIAFLFPGLAHRILSK